VVLGPYSLAANGKIAEGTSDRGSKNSSDGLACKDLDPSKLQQLRRLRDFHTQTEEDEVEDRLVSHN
jgi:hypothetical protein